MPNLTSSRYASHYQKKKKDHGLVVVVEVNGRPTKGDIVEFLEEGLDNDIDRGVMYLNLKKDTVRCASEDTSDT